MTTSTDFLASRSDLHQTRFVETRLDINEGQVLVKIDSFALTANNITYGAFGDAMMYWNFFPAPEGWGRIPVWGFGDVVESRHDGVQAGERIYGYFPMSTHLIVEPVRPTPLGFLDGAAHRQKMSPVYNNYLRVTADPAYSKKCEPEQALLRPLFMTSFFIDDFLASSEFFGAREVVISSASSKTSLALAFLLHASRSRQVVNVGLTSAANADFVTRTQYYDRVITYDAIAQSPHGTTAVYVDMAGNSAVRASVHKHWDQDLKYSCSVGATHWDQMPPVGDLPGPRPTMFFAPDHIRRRTQDWGQAGVEARTGEAWNSFVASVDTWMKITTSKGPAEIERIYRDVLSGKAKPDQGHMLSL